MTVAALLLALLLLVLAVLVFDRNEWAGFAVLLVAAFVLVFGVGVPAS